MNMKLATLCYLRRDGQTLMIHRIKKANDMHAGKWNGLGGKLNPGESPEECAVREVFEESGLKVHNPHLKGILTFPAFSQDEDWYVFVYVVEDFEGELIDSAEGNLRWIDNADLTGLNLWEGDPIFLPWLDRQGIFSGKFIYIDGKLVSHEVVFYD
jgi:8-oxo-dGTP diphosphatase